MKNLLKKSAQFIKELGTVKSYKEIADLPSTYAHAEKLINAFRCEGYDYPEDIEEHIGFLCEACDEMDNYLQQWKHDYDHHESLYWEDKWELICEWWDTPLCELIPIEKEIRALDEERRKYIHANIDDIKYLDDKYLYRLYCLLEEIRVAHAERKAELKDCETPSWYDEPDYHEEYLKMEELALNHLVGCTPSDEVMAEQREEEDRRVEEREEEMWEAFFSKF